MWERQKGQCRGVGVLFVQPPLGTLVLPHHTHNKSRTLPAALCRDQQHILGAQPVHRGISREMRHCQDPSHALALTCVVADCVSESYINKHPMGEALTALKIPSDLYQGTEAEEQLCLHFGV